LLAEAQKVLDTTSDPKTMAAMTKKLKKFK